MSTPSPTTDPGRRGNPARGGGPPRRRRRLNLRAAAVLAALVLIGVPAFFLAAYLRERQRGSALLAEARELLDREPPEPNLALSYLDRFLEVSPRTAPEHLEALDLKGKLLFELTPANGDRAAILPPLEQLVRADPAGRHRDARRRLVQVYLEVGRSQAALALADELVDPDEAEGGPTAEDFRLLSRVLSLRAQEGDEAARGRAIEAAERANRLEPGDVGGAATLAYLYRTYRGDDPAKAGAPLDALMARPLSDADRAAAHQARYWHFLEVGRPDRARAELQEAIRLRPDDPALRTVAAVDALRRGDADAAREQLDAVPAGRQDEQFNQIKGEVDVYQNDIERALDDWHAGLMASGGTSEALTWRLAYVLLRLGRADRAGPLVAQYHRLTDRDEPSTRSTFLDALMLLKRGKPAEALAKLEPIRLKAGRSGPAGRADDRRAMDGLELEAQVESALGQCYEALGRDGEALAAYRKSAEAVRTSRRLRWVEPWLSAADLLMRDGRFDEAAAELEDGLVSLRDEPTLLAALARVRLAEQSSLPPEGRSWAELERALERGRKAAPADPELVKLQAGYLTSAGRPEEADALLEAAIDPRHRPRDPELYIALAEIRRRAGRLDEAVGVLDRGLEAVGERSSLRIARAQLLLSQGHEKAAVDALAAGTARAPDDQKPALWRALGDLHRRRGDPAAARRAYARWAELDPADPQPRLRILDLALAAGDDRAIADAVAALEGIGGLAAQLAQAAMRLNGRGGADQLDEAARDIDRIVAEHPAQPVGYLLRGQLLERRGDLDGAVGAYREARERDGGPEALRALMSVLARGRKFDEMRRLRAELGPGELTPELEQMVAGVALTLGETDQAEEIAREIVQADAQGLNTRVWEAGILNALGKPEEAEKSLRALIDRRPTELAPRVALMLFFTNRGRKAEAAEVVEQIRGRVQVDRLGLVLANCYQVIGDRERAAEAYRDALRGRPEDPETNRRAVAFFKAAGRVDEAVAALRELIRLDPDQDWAGRELALLLSGRAGDRAAWSEALDLAGSSARPDDTPEDRLVRATVLARAPDPGRRREAIGILEGLIAEGMGTVAAGAHDLLARIRGDAGQLPQAIEHAKAAAARGTDDGSIAYYIELLLRDNKPDQAEPEVARLARLEGESPRVAGYRALILRANGRGGEAAELLERAVAGLPDAPGSEASGRGLLDLLVRLDQPDAAARVGRELAKRWPASGWALGLILARAGDHDEALRACQDAAEAGSTVEAALAAAQIASGRPEGPGADDRLARADALLEAASRARPGDVALLFSRAVVQRSRGQDDLAAGTYRELLTIQPDNIAALNNLAWTLSEDLGEPGEALGPIERAVGLSDSPSLLDTRGVVLTRLGRLDEAIRDLEAAARANPSATTYYHLARAHHEAGHADAFREARDRARRAGLAPEQLQPGERAEMKQLME